MFVVVARIVVGEFVVFFCAITAVSALVEVVLGSHLSCLPVFVGNAALATRHAPTHNVMTGKSNSIAGA